MSNADDERFMRAALVEARKCRGANTDPKVGAVAVRNGRIVARAFRGELKPGDHAEYTLLEGKLKNKRIAGATVYTTLEPCTKRGLDKEPCAHRLIGREIGRVVFAMVDPNPKIQGTGLRMLQDAGKVVGIVEGNVLAEIRELNSEFIRAHSTVIVQHAPALATSPVLELRFSCKQPLAATALLRAAGVVLGERPLQRQHWRRAEAELGLVDPSSMPVPTNVSGYVLGTALWACVRRTSASVVLMGGLRPIEEGRIPAIQEVLSRVPATLWQVARVYAVSQRSAVKNAIVELRLNLAPTGICFRRQQVGAKVTWILHAEVQA